MRNDDPCRVSSRRRLPGRSTRFPQREWTTRRDHSVSMEKRKVHLSSRIQVVGELQPNIKGRPQEKKNLTNKVSKKGVVFY